MHKYTDDVRAILDYSSASLLASYQPQILDRRQAAETLGLSYSRFAEIGRRGEGPVFFRAGSRGKTHYRRADIDAWIKNQTESR